MPDRLLIGVRRRRVGNDAFTDERIDFAIAIAAFGKNRTRVLAEEWRGARDLRRRR